MSVVLLFLDGVGIGAEDPDVNPMFAAELPTLRTLLGGRLPSVRRKRFQGVRAAFVAAGATLGVPGLPQSGTGQTAIFTGINAARAIGRHFGPFPTTALRPIIQEKNIFKRLLDAGKRVAFANAFPKQFFEYTHDGTRRLTVTTLACKMAGIPLRTSEALRENKALSADLTRTRWPELGHPEIPTIAPAEGGRHLAELSEEHDFTLFEYWLTDHAGHRQDREKAIEVLERFDAFLGGLLDRLDLRRTLVVMISDHGNIEDLSTKGHTRNPVPCIAAGDRQQEFIRRVRNLTHITPAIVSHLTK